MSISVVINTYNAEKHLEAVLDAVQGFDEILICDMDSTDSTLDIARRYGCRIEHFARKNYNIVEPARDYAIHMAKSPWVLVVDADEIVTPELHDYLYSFIEENERAKEKDSLSIHANGLFIPRKNFFMGRFMRSMYPDYILRFFKKDLTYWPPVIHCSPDVTGYVARIPSKHTELALIHLADNTVSDIILKTDQYTENEISKKRGRHFGFSAIIWRPLFTLFRSFILKKGYKDGKPGFIKAVMDALYKFVIVAKFEEERQMQSAQPYYKSTKK